MVRGSLAGREKYDKFVGGGRKGDELFSVSTVSLDRDGLEAGSAQRGATPSPSTGLSRHHGRSTLTFRLPGPTLNTGSGALRMPFGA